MSANAAIVKRLEQQSQQADQIIARLKSQLNDLKKSGVASLDKEASLLKADNANLQLDVQKALKRLVALETSHGVIQIPLPRSSSSQAGTGTAPGPEVKKDKGQRSEAVPDGQIVAQPAESPAKPAKAEKKEKKEKSGKGAGPSLPSAVEPDITHVDLRIGRIMEVKRHPDADSLYVEQIDVGEAGPRTVVTGLVKHVPIEEMQNRLVILCCNLKPAKMRGILSQAMVMCAATADKVEILNPPEGVVPGDRVTCEGYQLSDDFPVQMNPKKKIFEQIKPFLRTNDKKVACYKGAPFTVMGKGLCVAPTLSDAEVR